MSWLLVSLKILLNENMGILDIHLHFRPFSMRFLVDKSLERCKYRSFIIIFGDAYWVIEVFETLMTKGM